MSEDKEDICCFEVPENMCICRKCIGECYVSSCDRKIQTGGMCGGIGTIKCDKFELKLI